MKKKLPLFFIFWLAVCVGILHFAGTYLYLYWRTANFDKLVHFFGGFFVAFTCLVIIYFQRAPYISKSHVVLVGLFAALMIGIAWELFELESHITSLSDKGYWFDNGSDVVFDIIGGSAAIFYFIQKYGRVKQSL